MNYRKIAAKAIERYLRSNRDEPVYSLYHLSVVADEAAMEAGKKRELFSSLYEYERLLPPGTKVFWKNGMLSVSNPFASKPGNIQEDPFVPGPFDVAVDMGPDYWGRKLLKT